MIKARLVRPRELSVVLALLLACPLSLSQGVQPLGGRGQASLETPRRLNRAPRIQLGLLQDTAVNSGQEVRFDVTVSDPDGDAITLRLLTPPPGMIFPPLTGAASPATTSLRWNVGRDWGGLRHLVFEAWDEVEPTVRTRSVLRVRVTGESESTGIAHGDVTGDGIPDVVSVATLANLGGIVNAGAAYVWKGGTSSTNPIAILRSPQPAQSVTFGRATGQGLQLADVTGDGLLDVIIGAISENIAGVSKVGAIYVWEGGPGLNENPPPFATLSVPGAQVGDSLGNGSGQGIQLADMTGDGVLDIVAGAPTADVGGLSNVGAIYLWTGGPVLSGAPAPTATLTVPGARAGDKLGFVTFGAVYQGGQGIQLVDVSGDGLLDVVAGASFADRGGAFDVGKIYVWFGGSALSGAQAPVATLRVPGAADGDRLGDPYIAGRGILFADVTGDGQTDIVASAQRGDWLGVYDSGAVFVWSGGSALSGTTNPLATLTVPGASSGDRLTGAGRSQGLFLEDVTGDGVADVVAGASDADAGGLTNSGAIYLWSGGAMLVGQVSPSATLTASPAAADDELGGQMNGHSIQIADLNGDGIRDIVAGAPAYDAGGVLDSGAIFVWHGGAGLAGSVNQMATLSVPGASTSDALGYGITGSGLQLLDVTGDGYLDVLAGTSLADFGAGVDHGAIYLWQGGPGLTGPQAPSTELVISDASAQSQALGAEGIQVADVTANGLLDVICCAAGADTGGVSDTGAIYVWADVATLSGPSTPVATLEVPGAAVGDLLGQTTTSGSGTGVLLGDMSGDGVLDVVAGASAASVGGVSNAGAAYVWSIGSATGSIAPTATFALGSPSPGDWLCDTLSGQAIRLVDWNADGLLDFQAGGSKINLGATDVGGILLWASPPTAPSSLLLSVPGATFGDQLGS